LPKASAIRYGVRSGVNADYEPFGGAHCAVQSRVATGDAEGFVAFLAQDLALTLYLRRCAKSVQCGKKSITS
jgi:hypothetical protein